MNAFVDASIIVGILRNEDDSEELAERLNAEAPHLYISPLVRFEAVSALVKIEVEILQNKTGKVTPADRARFIANARRVVDVFLNQIKAHDIDIDASLGQAALDAMTTYGRMAGHPARLNFGDCFAYAAAKKNQMRLLYKGDDFAQTDLA